MHGLTAAQIGEVAAAHQIPLHELTPQQASLEEAFMDITREEVEFKAAEAAAYEVGRMTTIVREPTHLKLSSEWPRHATSRRPVGVDKASLPPLDPLVAARRGGAERSRSRLSPVPSWRTTIRR